MSRKRTLKIVIDPACDFGSVGGWQAKDLIVRSGGRPIWSQRRHAWCTSERIATDVLAAAEIDGFLIDLTMIGGDA